LSPVERGPPCPSKELSKGKNESDHPARRRAPEVMVHGFHVEFTGVDTRRANP